MKLSRRQWFRYLGRAEKAVLAGGVFAGLGAFLRLGSRDRFTARPRENEQPEYTFRPPGAGTKSDFLSRCIGCYLCQDVCPVGCILMKPATETDRHTPYIIPRLKACTMCLKCGEVCPTGALQPLQEKTDVRMGVAQIDESLCVSHLRTGVCGACFTACPLRGDAITQGLFNAPTVHPESCTGCGLCEEFCIVSYRAIRVVPSDGKDASA